MSDDKPVKTEKPCGAYAKGRTCKDGREHCFNCGRHLDGDTCPKGCGGGNDALDDAANNED